MKNIIIRNNKKDDRKICIMGASLDTGNRGVSALAASTINIIWSLKPKAKITLLIGSKTSKAQEIEIKNKITKIPVANYRLSPKAPIHEQILIMLLLCCIYRIFPWKIVKNWINKNNKWINAVNESHVVFDIHGGDSFSDIYGTKKFLLGILPRLPAFILKKDFILLPQTYGPYNSRLSKYLSRFIIKRSKKIYSRDYESFKTINDILGKHSGTSEIKFCPDVAFVLDSKVPEELIINPCIPKRKENFIIGLNINGLMYNGGYSRDNMFKLKLDYKIFLEKLILELLQQSSADILFIPHTFGPSGNINSDPDANENVFQLIPQNQKGRIHLVKGEYNQYEIKGIIGLCEFFIGSRMHACIAALSSGIPTIGVAYSKKFYGVFNSIGVKEMVLDARYIDVDSAIKKVIFKYKDRNHEKEKIEGKMKSVKKEIIEIFKEIITK